MITALALILAALLGVVTTWGVLALRARDDRREARLFKLRGAWKWRK